MTLIEIYADVWCPFAHASLRAVVTRRHELGRDDVALRVHAWPLELVNGEPMDIDSTAKHIDDLRATCGPSLFAGFDPSTFPRTSLPALALAHAAYRVDDGTGERVSLALRNALFEKGRDIADVAVLDDIATAHGVEAVTSADEQSIRSDWEEGRRRGVEGSPHLFCGELGAFCPSLEIQEGEGGHVQVHPDPAALDAFLTACLAR